MKYIYYIIKNLKESIINKFKLKNKRSLENLKNLSSISVGDIIWAKRYNNNKEKWKIPFGHRVGPFIVLKNDGYELICSYGTGVNPTKYNRENYLEINSLNYNLSKKTFFDLNKMVSINKSTFIKKLDSLKKSDLEQLFKNIKLINRNYYIDNKKVNLDLPLRSGDVITDKNINYILVDIKDIYLYCLPIDKNVNNITSTDIKNLDYSKLVCLNINDNHKCIDTLNNNLFKLLLKNQEEFINNYMNEKYTQRGSVILKNSRYYYIYGEESSDWLVFEIFASYTSNQLYIYVNGHKFYTNFVTSKINKKEVFDTILLAKEDEKDTIKNSKKEYNLRFSNTKSKTNNNSVSYFLGDVIQSKRYKKENFLIIRKDKNNKNGFSCISLNKLKEGILDPVLILKSDARHSDRKFLYKIKWFQTHLDFDMKDIGKKNIINSILNLQKKYVRNLRCNNIYSLSTNQIKVGNIVERNDKRYIVTEIVDNIIGCIKPNVSKSECVTLYFNIDELKIVNNLYDTEDTNMENKNNVKIKKI